MTIYGVSIGPDCLFILLNTKSFRKDEWSIWRNVHQQSSSVAGEICYQTMTRSQANESIIKECFQEISVPGRTKPLCLGVMQRSH
jgi:hypothetical protein